MNLEQKVEDGKKFICVEAIRRNPGETEIFSLTGGIRWRGHFVSGPYTNPDYDMPAVYICRVGPPTVLIQEDRYGSALQITAIRAAPGVGEGAVRKDLVEMIYPPTAELAKLNEVSCEPGHQYSKAEAILKNPGNTFIYSLTHGLKDRGHYVSGPYIDRERNWSYIYVAHIGTATVILRKKRHQNALQMTAIRSLSGVGEEVVQRDLIEGLYPPIPEFAALSGLPTHRVNKKKKKP